MKFRDCEIGGSGCDNFNVVSVLIQTVNNAARERAFNEYLKSAPHSFALLAIPFGKNCRREIRKINAGRPSPRAPFSCCRNCFVELLTAQMQLTYPALDTELDGNDNAWNRVPINDAPDESDTDALEDFLIAKCHADYVTAYSPALKDIEDRNAYLDTFCKLLRLSARLAKRLDESEAAKHLLEALGMTLGDSSIDLDIAHQPAVAKYKSRETAEQIYDVASLGWRQLWAAVEYAALKPLPLKNTSKRKN